MPGYWVVSDGRTSRLATGHTPYVQLCIEVSERVHYMKSRSELGLNNAYT